MVAVFYASHLFLLATDTCIYPFLTGTEELVAAIQADIRNADERLNSADCQSFKAHKFFSESIANGTEIVVPPSWYWED